MCVCDTFSLGIFLMPKKTNHGLLKDQVFPTLPEILQFVAEAAFVSRIFTFILKTYVKVTEMRQLMNRR